MNYKEILEQMKKLAIGAGEIIMEVYQTDFEVDYKGDASPVTLADKGANHYIVEGLHQCAPDIFVLSEEMKDDRVRLQEEYCFIVDPLDGTKEFVKRNGQFTVNIALVYQQHPVLGVIYVPVEKKMYYAMEGEGSFRTDLETGETVCLHVTDKLDQLTWVGSKSHSTDKEKALIEAHQDVIQEVVSAGSSLKGCLVAEGRADIYYRYGYTCEWDTAAMHCIAEQAGAIVCQLDHTELLYNRENTLNEKGFYIVNRRENIWS